MKKLSIVCVLMFITVIFTSCDLLFGGKRKPIEENNEPVYKPDYAWQLQLDGKQLSSQAYTEGKYFYLLEFIAEVNNVGKRIQEKIRLVKIDMESGTYVWKSSKVFQDSSLNFSFSNIVKIGDRLYYMSPYGVVYCHSDLTGDLEAAVRIGMTEKEAIFNRFSNDIVTDGIDIYWGSRGNSDPIPTPFFKLDTSKIDYNIDEIQTILPESIYVREIYKECTYFTAPIIDRGFLYFITSNFDYTNGKCILVAIDLSTKNILWETMIERTYGLVRHSLYINEDSLYVLDYSLLKVNKNTGEIIFRYDEEEGPIFTKPLISPSKYTCGIQYHEGKFYYTTVASRDAHLQINIAKEHVYSLVCVNAEDFRLEWGFHPVGGTSSTFPIIANDRAYIVTHLDGLRVFDIKTGQLIGVDKTVLGWGDEVTFLYKNYYIFFNTDFDTNRAKLCAIRV
ncbi:MULTISPECIES: hypothetical protein [unclassified Treponema]|uniref:hypothetical protein n=1 Tax=unclassified Treponema TaxID=2638727 RepID=UPI0020A267A5|nr:MULTISPECIES: hypothetical protein [unclassified Treponema]UTC68383.1 hypothetical protein E4O06_07070 [Treponema sp. OMZ 789]UTC71103.1 hypothetical protein E4O01_07210 [Treponema sp. OMZ 790]UTC73844.1 hypothetical protein E4O02_07405 [Treponema sp. OMZ 791]